LSDKFAMTIQSTWARFRDK